jgi:hypothetical protein
MKMKIVISCVSLSISKNRITSELLLHGDLLLTSEAVAAVGSSVFFLFVLVLYVNFII